MSRKKKQPGPKFKNIDIHINEFGEIEHKYDIDEVNEFLNQNTTDWRIQAESENKDHSSLEEE
ncbi:MAG: hypothetical protein J5I59_06070 [Saprospiraceae bacterium]|nr:hypothetical protein [Saprospiraceae bacterium]